MKKKYSLEVTKAGYANGLSLQLAEKQKKKWNVRYSSS